MASSARSVAWELLCALHRGRDEDIPLPALLDRAVRKAGLDKRDAGLCTELIYGVLRAEQRLFRLVAPFLHNPDRLPEDVRILLLLGVYEVLFLDHIPARATLNEIVGLTRSKFGKGLGGVLNAVLRGVDREVEALIRKDTAFLDQSPSFVSVEDIAVAGSLPLWLAQTWLEQYGATQAWNMALASAIRPLPAWRLNVSHPDWEGCARLLAEAGAFSLQRTSWVFPVKDKETERARQYMLAALESAGRISRQGTGSTFLAEILAARIASCPELADASLWDACCGRGGKSCALLEHGIKVSLCSDPSLPRLEYLRKDLQRLALPAPELRQGAVQELAPERCFSLILLDVPCSGTGTLARNPELRLRLSPEKLCQLQTLQAEMLDAAWAALMPGGILAYATCALNKGENEGQITAFASRYPACLPGETQSFCPEEGHDSLFLGLLHKEK